MRIAIIAPLVTAIREPQRGGSQAFLSDLALGLAGRGNDVHVYAASGSDIPGVKVIDSGIDPESLAATLYRPSAPAAPDLAPAGAGSDAIAARTDADRRRNPHRRRRLRRNGRHLRLRRDAVSGGMPAEAVGFGFEGVVLHDRELGAERVLHAAGALLHDMRQFVAQELLAVHAVGPIAAGSKIHVCAHREGDGADTLRLRPDMHAHSREIGAKGSLHLAAHRFGQWLAAARSEPELPGLDRERAAGPVPLHRSRLPSKSRRRTRRPRRKGWRRRPR